ncbi:MAG TPA: hypothetical protein VF230_07985 [Acidimicrobiales bacterium]
MGARSPRSYEPVTDVDLRRLADLGEEHHDRFRAAHPAWAGELLIACLAQGAARHRIDGVHGVKDFDVWLFYALPPGRSGAHFPWNRYTHHVDFGPSPHGRPEHSDAERANPAYDVDAWEAFAGRRVDLLARAIPAHADSPEAALRQWLTEGSRRRPRPGASGSSAWWLSRSPVIDLSRQAARPGAVIWDAL